MEGNKGRTLEDRLAEIPDEDEKNEDGNSEQAEYKEMRMPKGLDALIELIMNFKERQVRFVRFMLWIPLVFLFGINIIYWFIKIWGIVSISTARAAWNAVNKERVKRKYRASRLIMACMEPFAALIGFVAPTAFTVLLVTGVLVKIDRALYMNMDQDPWVIAKVSEFDERGSENLTDHERISAIVHATTLQLKKELNGKGGWMSNDVTVLKPFDNPQNREQGTRYTTKVLAEFESKYFTRITKGNAKEDPLMLQVYDDGNLSFGDKVWGQYFIYSSESNFFNGLNLMDQYVEKLNSGDGDPNATTTDLKMFLTLIIDDILAKAHDPVRDRTYNVPFDKIDDQIYNAVGYVAPLYNVLPVYYAAYRHEIDKNTARQIEESMELLDAIVHANPSIVVAFDGWSLFGDHRSKMSRYLDQLTDILGSIRDAIRT